jgi:hypothetical protein
LIILAASVIFAAAEPILSARAMAMTEREMERILEDEGDIRDSSGWQDISDIPGISTALEILDTVLDLVGDITSSEFYINDILNGMLEHFTSIFKMIPDLIEAIFEYSLKAVATIASTLLDAGLKLLELVLNPFEDLGDWISDMIGRIGMVTLGNPPPSVLLSVLLERLQSNPDALRVELGPLIDNFLIAEVIWLASKFVAGAIADSIGAWWADCIAMFAVDAEDVGIAFIKFEELGLFKDWDKDIQDNYARDHEALASGKKVPLSMPAKLGGLYDGLSASGAFSFAANPESALRGAYGGYRTARPEELYVDDYKDGTRSALDYARGFAEAVGAEARDFVILKSRISTLGEAAGGAKGYREALQARNGIRVFAAQEAVNMRLDVARQIDMMNRQAMDEEQKHNYLVSAFERSVGTWRSVSPAGASY